MGNFTQVSKRAYHVERLAEKLLESLGYTILLDPWVDKKNYGNFIILSMI